MSVNVSGGTGPDTPAPPAPELRVDPAKGDPTGQWLCQELDRGNWEAARGLLARVHDADDRHFYAALCANRQGRPEWLDAWVAAEPYADTPLLVRGAHSIYWAWEARGSASAEQTQASAFKVFWERLELAEADLKEAAARAPGDPTPLAFLITSCRGLQLGLEELGDRFKEVLARHPGHRAAHSSMLQGLSAKWGGSHRLMFNFARDAAARSVAGTRVAAVVAEAHIEYWLGLDDREQQQRYFEAPEILAELHRAADWSVRHPAWRPSPGWPLEHNLFAFCFAMGDDHRAAVHHLEAIGNLLTTEPWQYFNADVVQAFTSLRDRSYQLLRR